MNNSSTASNSNTELEARLALELRLETEERLKQELKAIYDANMDDLQEEFEDLVEALNSFDAGIPAVTEIEELQLEAGSYLTVASYRSEAGDDYLEVLPGALSKRELALKIFASSPSWWQSPDFVSFHEVRVVKLKPFVY